MSSSQRSPAQGSSDTSDGDQLHRFSWRVEASGLGVPPQVTTPDQQAGNMDQRWEEVVSHLADAVPPEGSPLPSRSSSNNARSTREAKQPHHGTAETSPQTTKSATCVRYSEDDPTLLRRAVAVYGAPQTLSQTQLRQLVSRFGSIFRCRVLDVPTGRFGVVIFNSPDSARSVLLAAKNCDTGMLSWLQPATHELVNALLQATSGTSVATTHSSSESESKKKAPGSQARGDHPSSSPATSGGPVPQINDPEPPQPTFRPSTTCVAAQPAPVPHLAYGQPYPAHYGTYPPPPLQPPNPGYFASYTAPQYGGQYYLPSYSTTSQNYSSVPPPQAPPYFAVPPPMGPQATYMAHGNVGYPLRIPSSAEVGGAAALAPTVPPGAYRRYHYPAHATQPPPPLPMFSPAYGGAPAYLPSLW